MSIKANYNKSRHHVNQVQELLNEASKNGRIFSIITFCAGQETQGSLSVHSLIIYSIGIGFRNWTDVQWKDITPVTFHRVANWKPGLIFFFEGSLTLWKGVRLFATHQLKCVGNAKSVILVGYLCCLTVTSKFSSILMHVAWQVFRISLFCDQYSPVHQNSWCVAWIVGAQASYKKDIVIPRTLFCSHLQIL